MTDFSLYRPNVGLMLINKQKKVWMGLRKDSLYLPFPLDQMWQMPQGGIDDGETPVIAAHRELYEETSVKDVSILDQTKDWICYDLPERLQFKIWNGKFKGQRQLWFLCQMKGDDSQININTDHPEFVAWKWEDPSKVLESTVVFKRDVYKNVLNSFKHHL